MPGERCSKREGTEVRGEWLGSDGGGLKPGCEVGTVQGTAPGGLSTTVTSSPGMMRSPWHSGKGWVDGWQGWGHCKCQARGEEALTPGSSAGRGGRGH